MIKFESVSKKSPAGQTAIDDINLTIEIDQKIQEIEQTTTTTTDVELLKESMQNQSILTSFLEVIQEVSIECILNDDKNCRKCNPTNIPLFIDNIDLDMVTENPCKEFKEEKIIVDEIIINDTTYYYKDDPDSVYGYKIFEFDEQIGGFRPMPEIGLFQQIFEKINQLSITEKK